MDNKNNINITVEERKINNETNTNDITFESISVCPIDDHQTIGIESLRTLRIITKNKLINNNINY